MYHFGMLTMLCSMMAYSLGFTMDRSAALVPSTWDTAPSLDTYQKTTDTKMKLTEQMSQNQTREKRSTTENITIGMKIINDNITLIPKKQEILDILLGKPTGIPPPSKIKAKNIIILLIENDINVTLDTDPWKEMKYRLPSSVEGFIKSCDERSYTMSSGVTAEKNKDCDCKYNLRMQIGDLLAWARHARGMTTGIVFNSNFSIPPFTPYDFDEKEADTDKPKVNGSWQTVDFGDRPKAASSVAVADLKTEGVTSYDGTWNVFDILSKIRMAFFRSLFESLSKNNTVSSIGKPSRPLHVSNMTAHQVFIIRPPVISLIEKTLKELKSFPNKMGYMLIATVPHDERLYVLQFLHIEISRNDTILFMLQICPQKDILPIFVEGPFSEIFEALQSIQQLPIIIRKVIENDCQNSECMNQQKHESPIVSHMPIEIYSQEEPMRKRVIRNEDDVKKSNTVNSKKTTMTENEIRIRSSSISSKAVLRDLRAALIITISVFVALTCS